MIIVNKLYRKNFNQYNVEDWKYIFSIYALRDRYNFTEEEFLAAELIDKVEMMKKMDDNLFVKGTIDIDSLHKNESVFAPCPEDEGCKVIQDFLEDEDVKDKNPSKYEIPACDPENSCDVIQDFLEEDGIDKFAIFRNIQSDYYSEIYQCQNRIEECKKKIRAEIQDIQVYRQKLDEAFNQYIE
jgi:hypothetical protein